MAESPVAPAPVREEAPSISRSAHAPETAGPELAGEAAAQAIVRAFHPGAGGSGAAGGSAGPPTTPTWTARSTRVAPRDLVALQRMAGNKAVSRMVARRGTASGAVRAATVQRDTTPPAGTETLPAPANAKDENKPQAGGEGGATEPQAMVVRSDTSAQAALDFAKWGAQLVNERTKQPLKFVIVTLEPKSMKVYNRDGGLLPGGTFELALPKGTSFDEGVFVTMPGGGQSMRMRLDPARHRFRPYENAAILQEIEQKGKAPKGSPGADKGSDKGEESAKPEDAQGSGPNVMQPASKAPKGFELRKYVKDPSGLDRLGGEFGDAVEFLIVRTPLTDSGGGTGKGGGKVTTGFVGELEGHGSPPNRPGWPVTMEGPKMLPIGGTGNYAANVNWAANGSDQLSMVSSQIGTSIHYRWEVFNITAQAKAEAERQARKAREAKAAIAALMGKGLMPDAADGQTQTAVRSDVAAKGGKGTGGGAKPAQAAKDPTAPPPGPTDENENAYADELQSRRASVAGSGTDVTGLGGANVEFQREFKNLWKDTKRSWNQVGSSAGGGFFERRSDDLANVTAVGLLPISALVTSLGASLRWSSEFFAGERQQQEIPMKQPGTFLIRVVASPRADTDRDGNPIIRPSTVATQVVEVVEMDRMVREGLDDPGAREKEAQKAVHDAQDALAKGKGTQDQVDAAKAKFENVSLDVSGDPRILLQTRIHDKEKELQAARDKWEKYSIRGPIIEVEDQLDILRKRLELYNKQDNERRQGAGNETRLLAPGMRITATLASEVTGQPYPLVLSVGPMKSDAGTFKWMVLDATSKKAESFEGESSVSAHDAIEKALKKFGGDAQYGRGTIGVRLSREVMKQLEPGDNPEFRIESQAVGWAIARSRIDDLVMTLVALGLMVASAGTAAAIIGAAVAAAKLIHRLFAGTLELDVETISDLLAVLGGAGALVGASAKASQVAAGLRVKKIGELFVMLPESAAVEGNLAKASAAFAKAAGLAHKVEMANEALGYAGLVWGNATFLMGMADISIQESDGKITHAEARRQRATAIGGAIQNNGLFLAGNVKKAREANAAAAKAMAGTKGGPTDSSAGGGNAGGGGASDSTTTTATDPAAGTSGTAGGTHDPALPKPVTPIEITTPTEQGGPKEAPPGEKPVGDEGGTKGGGTKDEAATRANDAALPKDVGEPGQVGEHKPGETTTPEPPKPVDLPAPGSKLARSAAKKIIEGVATGSEPHGPVEDAIKMAGNWKQGLKKAISSFREGQRAEAEKALVEAREHIVNDTWAKVQKEANGRFDKLRLENAGTKSFGSDIDATIRPLEGTEAGDVGSQMAEQVKMAGEAAQAMSKALRARVGGETDVVIDTNIYSFIGEGRIRPTGKAKASQQHADIVAGLAEQLRGQGEEQFNAFEKRLLAATKDKAVHQEAKTLLAEARKFHDERVAEYKEALKDAKADPANKTPEAQQRAAKEHILGRKKQRLGELMSAPDPDIKAITEEQAGINWFAPDAYATPSAFKQGVGHGQRLKGTAGAAERMSPKEVATKLREAAAKLPADDPRSAKLKADAEIVDRNATDLESTLREHKDLVAEAPMNAKKVSQVEERAARLREAIADKANQLMIAELMHETAPGDRPGPERLIESAAASGANQGMLEEHVRHALDIDSMVKAAAKYAGRIAMAEFLSGLRPSTNAVGRAIAEFVKGRWGIMESVTPEIMRDMFVRFAELKGLQSELKFDKDGHATGATDSLKQAFVHEVRGWARNTNDGIQVAAIGSKAYDSPAALPQPAPGGPAGPSAEGGGGSGGGAKGPRGGGGGGGTEPPPSSGGAGPDSSADRPTIPAPAAEDNGPATVKYPKASPEDNGPATKKEGGAGPAGGIKVDPPDGIATTVRSKDHPNDLVRLEIIGNTIKLTDIYRRADSQVTGSMLLTAGLKEVGAVAGNELYISQIVNPETMAAYKDGIAAELSKLGKTAARGLEGAGLAAGTMRWEHDGEKLHMSIEIK